MKLAIDVHYGKSLACTGGVFFQNWTDNGSTKELTCTIKEVKQYKAGSFYKRELPCIMALLKKHDLALDRIVIDGYVFLDGHSQPGLGKHLFDSLNGEVDIIGVAKNAFSGIDDKYQLHRGHSNKPLYITTTGNLAIAKKDIASMHGEFRMPTLLKRADQLCRAGCQ